MKVGLIGPKDVLVRTHHIIKAENPNDQLIDLPYETYLESPCIVRENQEHVDALLFGGKIPFKLAEAQIEKKVPWEYMPRRKNTLFRAMLEATFTKKYDITNISIDTYGQSLVIGAYQEIGANTDRLNVHIAQDKILDPHYKDYLMHFHLTNYQEKHVSCIITGVSEVYHSLLKLDAPCIRTLAAEDIIIATYSQLQLKYCAQVYQNRLIAVIAVRVDTPSIYSLQRGEEYLNVVRNMKIIEKINLFASQLDAAVTTNNYTEFLIFTSKEILELETNNLESVYLLDLIQEISACSVKIGIGYGSTVKDAKYNAYSGVMKAAAYPGSVAFAVIEGHEIIGPIQRVKDNDKPFIDKDYLDISLRTGISTNTLHNLYVAMTHFDKGEFTSRELANLCDMSPRNMDRIITKLLDAGLCEIVGERLMKSTGRPRRILRLIKPTV